MSIVRVGMAEDGKFSDGWNAIFDKGAAKKPAAGKPEKKTAAKKAGKPIKKAAAKKK